MEKKLLVLASLMMFGYSVTAQNLNVRYDATKGVSGLVGASSVYIHSGGSDDPGPLDGSAWEYVVGNWGQDDGVGKMTSVGTDLWELNMGDAVAYYSQASNGPVTGTAILRMGMVFRNAEGTASGKDVNDQDIFCDLSGAMPMVYNADGTSFDGVIVTVVGIDELENNLFQVAAFPNPLSDRGVIAYTLNEPADKIWIRIYDNTGRVLAQQYNRTQGLGTYLYHFHADNLSNGMYSYQVNVDGFVKGGLFAVVR